MMLVIGVVLSVLMTYPLQVTLCRVEVSVGKVVVPAIIGYSVLMLILRRTYLRLSRASLIGLGILWFLVAWYLLSAGLNGVGVRSGMRTLQVLIQYAVWFSLLLLFERYAVVRLPNPLLEWAIAGVALANVSAVVIQSIGHRVPDRVDFSYLSREFFYVGPLMRAGRIYSDPNALALMLVLLAALAVVCMRKKRVLKVLILIGLAGAILLTFSRAAYLFAGGIVAVRVLGQLVKQKKWALLGTMAVGGIVTVIGIGLMVTMMPEVRGSALAFYERFIGEEGAASSYSRIRQYQSVADLVDARAKILVWGAGPGVADELFDENIHNFFLATLADAGIPALVSVLALMIYCGILARTFTAQIYLLYAMLQLMTLPNFFNNLFLACGFCLLRIEDRDVAHRSNGKGALVQQEEKEV